MITRPKPRQMIPFDRNKHAALFYDGDRDRFVCAWGYEPQADGTSYAFHKEIVCTHPLEALNHYEASFCPGIRHEFGDWLEDQLGYERYSGQKSRTSPGESEL